MKVKMMTMTGDTLKVMPGRTADSPLEGRGRVF
jgi:isoaspartyl peptidase/L-asparaginase-like protein (Ntn-hydrolase superfamily)